MVSRTYIYIISMILGLAVLSYTLTHGLYISSTAVALLMAIHTVTVYRRQRLLHYERLQVVRENAEMHERLVEDQRRLQFMQHLTENVETAVIVAAPSGHIDWCNEAAKQLLGSNPTVLPQNIADAVAEKRDEVDNMAVSATQLRIEGHPRTVIALKDIQKQMERHEMEIWRQLTRVLAHEILNSITPIITITESLKPGQEGTDLGMSLSVIERRCHSLLNFVESYRKLARVEMPQKTTFEASELMSDLERLFPSCHCTCNPTDLTLTADRAQLEQVLINLVHNAEEAGASHIALHAEPQKLTLSDNGQGMSAEVMQRIFVPFFTTKSHGSGIGLSLCKQIITQHGGRIHVESQPGEGTTFVINLEAQST